MLNQTQSTPWSRSPDGMAAGVCAGLAERFEVNANLLRLLWLLASLFAGSGVLLYLALWWILPRRGAEPVEPSMWIRQANGTHTTPLMRTMVDRKLLGVCGGLARHLSWDASLVRVGVLSLATLSFGLVGVAYLVGALLMPEGKQPQAHHQSISKL